MARLGDVCKKGTSNIAQKDLEGHSGIYPIYGASGFITNVDFYQQENSYIAVVKDGAGIGRIMKLPAKSSVIGTMQYIIPNDTVDISYLAYAMEHMNLSKYFTGSTIPHIYFKDYQKEELPLPSLDEQRKIAAVLDKVSDLIAKRRQQLDKLDELIKARFVEMFGDPIINNMSWPKALIGDNCFVTKLAGFEYTQYIHYEDSGDVVMVKAQNVKKGKLNDKDISFISNEVSDSLPRSQLAPGDVVMTYVGANIGDVALIDEKHKYHLAPNVAKIRPNSKVYDSTYFMYMLMFLNSYIMENSADTAKAALGMERIRKLVVCIPPIDLQRYFSDFVKKIDKSKSVVQKSLEQLETLKKALMQEYFG